MIGYGFWVRKVWSGLEIYTCHCTTKFHIARRFGFFTWAGLIFAASLIHVGRHASHIFWRNRNGGLNRRKHQRKHNEHTHKRVKYQLDLTCNHQTLVVWPSMTVKWQLRELIWARDIENKSSQLFCKAQLKTWRGRQLSNWNNGLDRFCRVKAQDFSYF